MKTFRTTRFIADRVIIQEDDCWLSNGCQHEEISKHNALDMMRQLPIEVVKETDLLSKTSITTYTPIKAKVTTGVYKVDYYERGQVL